MIKLLGAFCFSALHAKPKAPTAGRGGCPMGALLGLELLGCLEEAGKQSKKKNEIRESDNNNDNDRSR